MRMRFAAAVESYAQALTDAEHDDDSHAKENAKRSLPLYSGIRTQKRTSEPARRFGRRSPL